MKTSNHWFGSIATAALLSAPLSLCAQNSNTAAAGPGIPVQGSVEPTQPPASAPRLSRGVVDILKMQEKGIDKIVLRSFIENSAVAYQPTAEEIIYLHQQGLPDDLTTLMIQHGAQVRAQAPAIAPNPVNTWNDSAPVGSPAYAPQQAMVSAPAPVYAAPSPTYVYTTQVDPYPVYNPSVYVDFGFWGAPYWGSGYYRPYGYGGFHGRSYVNHGWGGGGFRGGVGGVHGGGGHAGGGHSGGGGHR